MVLRNIKLYFWSGDFLLSKTVNKDVYNNHPWTVTDSSNAALEYLNRDPKTDKSIFHNLRKMPTKFLN
jgi:hypothetical protein